MISRLPKKKGKQKNTIPANFSRTEFVSLLGLKKIISKHLPESSTARRMILSEPDRMPMSEFIIKAKMYDKLISGELDKEK